MSRKGIKAVSLCAGLATRMRPLSLEMPKAAIPINGVPSLYYALHKLKHAGFDQVAINTHYQAEKVAELVAAAPFDQEIKIFHEPELLGSAGAYPPMESWRQGDSLLVYNPDIICDANLDAFLQDASMRSLDASLMVLPQHPHKHGNILASDEGLVTRFTDGAETQTYGCGIFFLGEKVFANIPNSGASNLMTALSKVLAQGGKIGVFFHRGFWLDFSEGIKEYAQSEARIKEEIEQNPNGPLARELSSLHSLV